MTTDLLDNIRLHGLGVYIPKSELESLDDEEEIAFMVTMQELYDWEIELMQEREQLDQLPRWAPYPGAT